jgi:PAS domain S-box-containing protein
LHPDDIVEFKQRVAASAQNLTFKLCEVRSILNSGEIKWIESASRPELQPDGAIIWDGIMLDITEQQNALSERKRVEADLATSQQKYYSLIQSINGIVWEYDIDTDRFSFVSDRAISLLGYPLEDWLLKTNFWQNHIYSEDLERTLSAYNDAIEYRYDCEFEYRMVAADGRVIWVYDISTLICDADGKAIATNGLIIDISDRKEIEIDLHQANERLELTNAELHRATRLKDEFLATMSHELRTPLNAILGMSEALLEEVFGDLNPRQMKSIATIERSGEHLLSLINDILDVSKISAGKLELNITEVSPIELCKSSLMFIKQKAIQQQLTIDTQIPNNLDKIFVDERRMRQVLINLLNNAVKFTPKGGIVTLSIWVESPSICHPTAGYCLCFSIRDTGIGIASDDISKLFQPFIQVDSKLNRKYEGTGLGLVLVKQLVELHGGFVTINSEVGIGSCFTVTIPQEMRG